MVITSTIFVAAQNELGETTVNSFDSDTTVWSLASRTVRSTLARISGFSFWACQGIRRALCPSTPTFASIARSALAGGHRRDPGLNPFLFLFLFNQEIVSDFELL